MQEVQNYSGNDVLFPNYKTRKARHEANQAPACGSVTRIGFDASDVTRLWGLYSLRTI